ncbi:MAG: DUF3180 domain-containing protein [Sporichthyaceae bacterium]
MTTTRLPVLLAIAAIAGGLGWAGGQILESSADQLPRVPTAATAVLVMLAAIFAWLALSTRARLAARREPRPGTDWSRMPPLNTMRVARYAMLARAGSLTGSAVAGLYGGYALFLLGERATPGRGELAGLAAAAAGAAVLAVAAALFLEHVCRIPSDGAPPGAVPA